MRQDELDLVVWQQVSALLADPSLIEVELERRLAELRQGDPARNQRARLERELARVTTATRRLVEAYQEELLTLDELRGRMPELRKKEVSLRTQLDTLDAQIIDRDSCLALADDLASFLARLHQAAQSSSVPDRQRVLRLLVREVLVGRDRILVRHSIPSSRWEPPPGLLLRGRSHLSALVRGVLEETGCTVQPGPVGRQNVDRVSSGSLIDMVQTVEDWPRDGAP